MKSSAALLFTLILLTFSSEGWSAVVSSNSFGAGMGLRFERSVSGEEYQDFSTTSLYWVKHWSRWQLVGEFSFFETESGDAVLNVERRHYELIPWVRYGPQSLSVWQLYVGAGLGFYWEKSIINFYHQEKEAMSRAEWTYGLSLGSLIHLGKDAHLDLEGRLMDAQKYQEPSIDLLARVGIYF